MRLLRSKSCCLTLRILLICWLAAIPAFSSDDPNNTWIAHNDVIYLQPPREAWQGLPLGNGRFGAQVWTPDGLAFQLNSSWGGALGFSLAKIHLGTRPGLFEEMEEFRQRLDLATATLITEIETKTGPVGIRTWIAAQTDVIVVEVDDQRSGDLGQFVEVETWHSKAEQIAALDSLQVLDRSAGTGNRPESTYPFALAVGLLDAQQPVQTEVVGVELSRLQISAKKYTLLITFAGSRDFNADVLAAAQTLLHSTRQGELASLREEHLKWWDQYWSRSYIQLSGEGSEPAYLANLWCLHMYAMGSCSRGDVIPKFNGGFWNLDKDVREWGAAYWHWNTQEMYWPLYAAGHFDLVDTYDSMYWKMLPHIQEQTLSYFGVPGAHYGETIKWDGRDSTGKGPPLAGVFANLRVPTNVQHTSTIYSTSAEIAMQFWWRYLYLQNREFLKEKAYPLMRSATDFYVAYLQQDEDGNYNMERSNAHETFHGVKNPATDLAALRYLFPIVIRASQILDVDADQRSIWQDRLDHLATWPIDPATQGIDNFERQPDQEVRISNSENPNVFPMGVFPLIRVGTPEFELGLRTFHNRKNVNVNGWTTDSVAASRLGLRDEMPKILTGHVFKSQDHPNGLMDYYNRNPAIHVYLEASGVLSMGLEEMLLQGWPESAGGTQPLIRLCPALPENWNARFKMKAIGGFEVECLARRGHPVTAQITSTLGGTMQVANPFRMLRVMDGGREVLQSADPIVTVSTLAGHQYVLTENGQEPLSLGPEALPANQSAKQLQPDSFRWIGIPVTGVQPPPPAPAPSNKM